jgi:ubiquitin C-terminal hydrolase
MYAISVNTITNLILETFMKLQSVCCLMNSMFASSQHQDSQELLMYLMSGLSEGLNKVRDDQHQISDQANLLSSSIVNSFYAATSFCLQTAVLTG